MLFTYAEYCVLTLHLKQIFMALLENSHSLLVGIDTLKRNKGSLIFESKQTIFSGNKQTFQEAV